MPVERDLVFYLAGLLDPAQALRFEERLAADPSLQAALVGLSGRWSPDVEVSVPQWRVPPPGLGVGAMAEVPAVFSEQTLRPGDRFSMRIDALPDAGLRRVVVLRKIDSGWDIVYPSAAGQTLTLTDLKQDTEGCFQLDLTVQSPPGRQRWAVALPEVAAKVDWSLPEDRRWRWLRDAVAGGGVPIASVDIEVASAG